MIGHHCRGYLTCIINSSIFTCESNNLTRRIPNYVSNEGKCSGPDLQARGLIFLNQTPDTFKNLLPSFLCVCILFPPIRVEIIQQYQTVNNKRFLSFKSIRDELRIKIRFIYVLNVMEIGVKSTKKVIHLALINLSEF